MWSIWNSSSCNPSYSVTLFHCRLNNLQSYFSAALQRPPLSPVWSLSHPSAEYPGDQMPGTQSEVFGGAQPTTTPARNFIFLGAGGWYLERNDLTLTTQTFLPGWEECGAYGSDKVRFRQFSGGKNWTEWACWNLSTGLWNFCWRCWS